MVRYHNAFITKIKLLQKLNLLSGLKRNPIEYTVMMVEDYIYGLQIELGNS